jgi:hypothetical protein
VPCFTVSDFLALVESERDWFEVLMAIGLSLGASPSYNVRMMLNRAVHMAAQLGPTSSTKIRAIEPWPYGDDAPCKVRKLQGEDDQHRAQRRRRVSNHVILPP